MVLLCDGAPSRDGGEGDAASERRERHAEA
jgi:hypothetical protein